MASSVQRLVTQVLDTSSGTYYVSPTGTWTQITKLLLVNTAGSSQTATISLVVGNSGGSFITTDGQALLPSQSFNSPNEYGLVLNPGDAIAALASAGASITLFLCGLLLQ